MKVIRPPIMGDATPRTRRVLAIVGDTQVGLWVVRSLGRQGLKVFAVCHSENGLAAHSRYASGAFLLESRPKDESFADELAELVDRVDAGSIMPIAESYHRALIDVRERFEPEVHVFSPSALSFNRATDKDAMHRLCVEVGVPVAEGCTLADLLKGPQNGRKLRYPLVLRTRNQNADEGGAPWKAAYATDEAALAALAERVHDVADNVIVQEYHPGAEDHVQVLMHEGEAFMAGEYIGEHHMPLAGGVTVQRVTCRHDDLIADAVKLLKALDWQGVTGVQFHYDPETDRYIFLEINPRFIGGLPTVIMAGFDAPFLLWQSHFEPERMKRTPYRLGLRTRVLGGDANWMLGMIRGDALPPGQKRLGKLSTVARFLWNFGPWTRDDVFSVRDPRPLWVDWKQMVRRLGSRSHELVDRGDTREEQA